MVRWLTPECIQSGVPEYKNSLKKQAFRGWSSAEKAPFSVTVFNSFLIKK